MVPALSGSELGGDARLHAPAAAGAHVRRATPWHAHQPAHLGGLVASVACVGQLAAAAQAQSTDASRVTQSVTDVTVSVRQVADTLGAGDFFHGALVHRLSAGGDLDAAALRSALAFAAATAARSIASFGTRDWLDM